MFVFEDLHETNPDFDIDKVNYWFSKLITMENHDCSREIYNGFLFAVGNNHAGTYYPILLSILPIWFQEITDNTNPYFQETSYEILIDLFFFEPEMVTDSKERLLIENKKRNMIYSFSCTNEEFMHYLNKVDIEFEL